VFIVPALVGKRTWVSRNAVQSPKRSSKRVPFSSYQLPPKSPSTNGQRNFPFFP